MAVIIARHTQTDPNLERRYSGVRDVPLNLFGVSQARALGPKLAGYKIRRAYSSDLIRAIQTARFALEGREAEFYRDPLLRELDVGAATGLTRDEIRARWTDLRIDTRHPECDFTSVGGESKAQCLQRYREFFTGLEDVLAEAEDVLVVVHGTAINFYLREAGLGSRPEQGELLVLPLGALV